MADILFKITSLAGVIRSFNQNGAMPIANNSNDQKDSRPFLIPFGIAGQ